MVFISKYDIDFGVLRIFIMPVVLLTVYLLFLLHCLNCLLSSASNFFSKALAMDKDSLVDTTNRLFVSEVSPSSNFFKVPTRQYKAKVKTSSCFIVGSNFIPNHFYSCLTHPLSPLVVVGRRLQGTTHDVTSN